MTEKIAKIAVEDTLPEFDILYSYLVPKALSSKAKPGCRVLVPFGRSNKKRQGIITKLEDIKDAEVIKLKPVHSIVDSEPVFDEKMIELALYLREHTFCTYFDALKSQLPSGLRLVVKDEGVRRNLGDKNIRMLRLRDDADIQGLTEKQQAVTEFLYQSQAASVKETLYYTGVTQAVITTLSKKRIVEYFEVESYRNPYKEVLEETVCESSEIRLSSKQQEAFDGLETLYSEQKNVTALLFGITGSGKTSVFMKLIEIAVKDGKNVIVMVPEIALTPQVLSSFHKRFGSKVAVLHSALSVGERLDEWKRIKRGEAQIAIGTRSAIFAPFESVGLIIMDEEQEGTYKSESSPRFHARDVAKFRAKQNKALFVLSSATPSVETYYYAKSGKYSLFTLDERYGNAVLPEITVVDMCYEGHEIFSNELLTELSKTIDRQKQAILLLNRRGHNTHMSCRSCKQVMVCPSCSISLTYHSANNRLMCHYCGHSQSFAKRCPECGEETVRYSGLGTQKVEEELSKLFPDAKILRLDADTTQSRYAFDTKIKQFEKGEFDILLGTQMVAKGLDFPNVVLVGVLCADQTLYADDFRSFERAFSLLTQVCGRSGRGDSEGKALIQSYTPNNEIILYSKAQDYPEFYESEIIARRTLIYPPFSDICMIGFVGSEHRQTEEASQRFLETLKKLAAEKYKELPLRIIGPTAATIPKVNEKYRYKLIIKCKSNRLMRSFLREALKSYSEDKQNKDVTAFIDMKPQNII